MHCCHKTMQRFAFDISIVYWKEELICCICLGKKAVCCPCIFSQHWSHYETKIKSISHYRGSAEKQNVHGIMLDCLE